MSSNASINVTVPTRAAEWIIRVLREAGLPVTGSIASALEDDSQLELRLLNVKQLKKISNEMGTQTIRFHNINISTTTPDLIFTPPKSNARKADWISAIAMFFQRHASNNNVYNILNGATSLAPAKKPSPAKKAPTTKHASKSPFKAKSSKSTKFASAKKLSPVKAARKHAAKKSPPGVNIGKKKVAKQNYAKPKSKSVSSTNAAMAADEALARSLQSRYMQEDIGQFMLNQPLASNSFQPWGRPLANSSLDNQIGNASTASYGGGINGNGSGINRSTSYSNASEREPVAGLKRPHNCNDSTKPKKLLPKVKQEPGTHASTSHITHSNSTASTATSAASEISLTPRDLRETNMVASLREMGFTDTREMLTALRAVAADRAEVAIVGFGSSGWSTQEQVDAAMMWIVTQREEAAEAEKLDQARISSEQMDASMEQSRRQNTERELKNADLAAILGSVEDDDSIDIRSRHFPSSVLLRNRIARSVLRAIASESIFGKEQVIRLLNLEKKARKWYGTVLPFSYFEYILCPRFGSWADEKNSSTDTTCQRLSNESDHLEKAMYNLSEQEEGGVGCVPKVFLAAQREASEKRKPTSAAEDNQFKDEDVLMVEQSPLCKSASGNAKRSGDKSFQVIELT